MALRYTIVLRKPTNAFAPSNPIRHNHRLLSVNKGVIQWVNPKISKAQRLCK